MPIRLVIFDLDGTLVDTARDITAALNHAIKPYAAKALSVSETIELIGEGTARLIENALGEANAAHKAGVIERFLKYYSEHLLDYSRPYPHVRETLEGLKGIKKAVVSNKTEGLSRRLLIELGLFSYFEMVVGEETLNEKKPSPEPMLYVLRNSGISVDEAIAVGDSNYDIEAGKAAGIWTVAVTYGYRPKETLLNADGMIDDIGELIPLLYEAEKFRERRKEPRHPVSDVYNKYFELKIKGPEVLIPASLVDVSKRGIKMISPIPLYAGETVECVISAPKSLTREVRFRVLVRHSVEAGLGSFMVGGEIVEADDVWFRVFEKIYEFIKERTGNVF
jgi:phosphoglycolate phosphatase